MKPFLRTALTLFVLLTIAFFPLRFDSLDWQFQITSLIFKSPVHALSEVLFPGKIVQTDFSSDSYSMLVLLLVLSVLAIFGALAMRISKVDVSKFIRITRSVCVGYLAFVLLSYGFDKVFKLQFYTPEPNILYTEFGNLDKDILYWSTMGTSHFYSVFLGSAEVLAAIFILFRRTRAIGLLLAIGILTNVFAVNIGFDISVKLFSAVLILISIFALWPDVKPIFAFFVQRKSVVLSDDFPDFPNSFWFVWMRIFLKFLIVGLSVFPFLVPKDSNAEATFRKQLRGAYQVDSILVSDNILPKSKFPYKRIFWHKSDYLIFQDSSGNMKSYAVRKHEKSDFTLLSDQGEKREASVSINPKDSIVHVYFKSEKMLLSAKLLSWRDLPALKDENHFLIEDVH